MKQFFRQPVHISNKDDLVFQIVEWWAADEENEQEELTEDSVSNNSGADSEKIKDVYTIRCFGSTANKESVSCKITGFQPYYYIKVSDDFNRIKLHHFLSFIENAWSMKKFHEPLVKSACGVVSKKDLLGFRNGKKYKFVKLVFNNYTAMMRSRYLFKKPTSIPNITTKSVKFKLYESNFEPFMRYCHIKDILMAGWIKLPKGTYTVTSDTATTQIEVQIDHRKVESLKDIKSMAPFLQASWDIEVYSCDYSFPDPNKKIVTANGNHIFPNEIFQISTTYKYHGDSSTLVKHLLTLKNCAPIDDPDVIVECCENERDLIKRFVNTISNMDPDIFYTYNGDSFDCQYLKERAALCGLEKYILNKLSRLQSTPAQIKKEFFSSSAYGDSEFFRMYVPGRLNYDLLIHYKRGMKKYASYKLDNIANEILKEGKHDVSAKDIFKCYERGTPEDIRKIGHYCIVDTELLQKLVDKQLILTNIFQLANVTFVPVGFLTTRGQTIKVFSQVLRKARQMEFLAPHTNFNEDTNSICCKTRDKHPFEEKHIGEYVEIDSGMKNGRRTVISGKIAEILDENTFIIMSDTELTEELFNRKCKHKYKEFTIHRLWPSDDLVDDTFTGATVLEATSGIYHDNIAVLDFASLE